MVERERFILGRGESSVEHKSSAELQCFRCLCAGSDAVWALPPDLGTTLCSEQAAPADHWRVQLGSLDY